MTRFEELIQKLQLELRCKKYADSTIKTYTSCLAIFLRAMNGKPKPLPFDEVKKFLAGIANQNYHKQFTATIRHFYRLVLKQPVNLDDIPYPRPTEYLPEIFSVEEVHRLVNSYKNLKHRAIIQIMYSCGLRISEVTNILLTNLNKDRLILRIAGAKGFKDRDVPVPAATMQLIISYYQGEKEKPRKWLFEGWGYQQYSVRSIQQLFYHGCRRIGITRRVKPHSLRHSRATHLHEAKVDIKDIQDFLGHSNIKTTSDYYLKLSKKSLAGRIEDADAIIKTVLNKQKLIAA